MEHHLMPQLERLLKPCREEMAEFAAELVRIPTENPPGRFYRRCLDTIASKLEALGIESQIAPVPGGDEDSENPRFWLKAPIGARGPAVYFHGHADVVPAQRPDQFEPRLSTESLFGRGSSDMKGGLASMIYAMRALSGLGLPERGRVVLQIVPDEETGGRLGSQALSSRSLLLDDDALAMFTAEPTGGVVWHASRGAITFAVRVRGRSSHVGLQYRGVNAFERMLLVTDALRELKREVEARRTSYPIEPEAARRSILMMGGQVAGGANFNLVPDNFSFSIDRRVNPEEDFDREKERLLEVLEGVRALGVDLTVDLIQEARSAGVSEAHPAARALAQSIASVTGKRPRFELCPGILEIRFYADQSVPAFAYGPGLLSVAHGPQEFVKRRDLEECATIYALTAAKLLGGPVFEDQQARPARPG